MRTSRTAVRVAAIALAAGIGLGTTGCTFLTPIATLNQYNPSDGINARVGSVDIRNAVGIINEDGTTINLLVTFVNGSREDVSLTVQVTADGAKVNQVVELAAGNALTFGVEDSDDLLFVDTGVRAGQLLPVYFQYGDEPGKTVQVPILDATQAEYEGLVRESPTPTPTSTPTPTPTPTETPAG